MRSKEKNLGQILNESRELHTWIFIGLHGLNFPKTKRLILSISAFDVVLDHFTGITALVEKRVYGSAFTLVRPLFEIFVRAIWLKECADHEDLVAFERDEFPKNFGETLKQIETLDAFKSKSLSGLKRQAWAAMNSYTHGGIYQISRRFTQNSIDPDFKDEEIIEVLKIAQMFALLAFIQLVLIIDRRDLEQLAIQKLYAMELFKKVK